MPFLQHDTISGEIFSNSNDMMKIVIRKDIQNLYSNEIGIGSQHTSHIFNPRPQEVKGRW